MNKKVLSKVLGAVLVVSLAGTAVAATGTVTKQLVYDNIKVTLDGVQLNLKDTSGNAVEPFMFDGTNYLPVRAVAEALGLEVSWDAATSTVVLEHPEDERTTYITRTGSKYHFDSSCNGGTYWAVPFESATGMGLEPCDKCAH